MASTGVISGGIQWTGVATGTDFKAMVETLVKIENRTVVRQQTWQSQWQAKLTSINQLDLRLGALKTGCQSYDTRDELLTRKATSSDEKVVTINNTSTAATGVFNITVGENIGEKVASRTFSDAATIGMNHLTDAEGRPIDANGDIIVHPSPPPGTPVDADGRPLDSEGNILVDPDPANYYYPPMTISMGGKTVELTYDATKSGALGTFHEDMTMEDLAGAINDKLADMEATTPDDTPKIRAEVVYDKTRGSGDTYSRLTIVGLEGGVKNHITVSDPTDLCMDSNSIDAPVTTSWVGSQAIPKVSADSNYTGHANKTITVVATTVKGNGILGVDDIEFSWADTEGKSGTFKVTAENWDAANNCLKEDIELLQGVKISFDGAQQNRIRKDEAFTIDCQTPVTQKAADVGLAQTDKWVHRGVGDLTSPVTKGQGSAAQFAYTYAGKEYTVKLSNEVGLQGLIDAINKDSNNPGVIASYLNDGMGTSTSYKLVLTGRDSGVENSITISDKSNLNMMPCGPETFTHSREASNSMFRVDGFPDDEVSWAQRPTNDVGDVFDGIVVTLQGKGDAQIIVQNDVTAMKDKIKQLIEAVNYAKSYIKEQTKFSGAKMVSKFNEQTQQFERVNENGTDAAGNSSSDPSGIMIGNYGFQMAQSAIDKMMTGPIFSRQEFIQAIDPDKEKEATYPVRVEDEERDGPSQEGLYNAYLEKHGLVYTRMSDLGIISDPDQAGQYILKEESKLTEALTKNPEAVVRMFTFTPEDGETMPGDGETKLYKHAPWTDEEARFHFGGFNVMMGYITNDMTRTHDDIDAQTGNVVKAGKGITKVLADNYAGIIKDIDDKILREQRRVSMVQQRLEDKFARLEVLLAGLEDQSKGIEAQISKLNGGA
ncbi:MAG: flagellar filament capping protein FliD [Candidatus Adiutrix sp.]|jgi:flagellar hook-associated protein 2|nr:flagellar filament capping protein FliD [Candidatus Adiutrix sp.]